MLAYSVKTPVYEGPLEVLLELIEKRKLFVSDVSLAAVTDDFIAYLDTHESFPLDESAEFIVVASTLMLVKSRSLLPQLSLTEEEESSIDDLEKRLALYKRTKELAVSLRNIFGQHIIFEKQPRKSEVVVFSPDKKTTISELLASVSRVLDSLPKSESIPKAVVRKMISLEETIQTLAERIAKGGRLNFKNFTGKDKIDVIVGFLAMLELVKRGAIRVTQEGRGEIEIESETLSTPSYA